MFLDPKTTESGKIATIPGEVGVTIAETRHKCSPLSAEDSDLRIILEILYIRDLSNCGNPLPCQSSAASVSAPEERPTFDEHIATVWILSS